MIDKVFHECFQDNTFVMQLLSANNIQIFFHICLTRKKNKLSGKTQTCQYGKVQFTISAEAALNGIFDNLSNLESKGLFRNAYSNHNILHILLVCFCWFEPTKVFEQISKQQLSDSV